MAGPGNKNTAWWLGAALAAAFVLRLALVVYAEGGGRFAFGDGRFYDELGRSWAAGRGLTISDNVFALEPGRGAWTEAAMERWRRTGLWDFIRPYRPTAFVMPLYPVFVGVIYSLAGPHILAARAVQLLLALGVPLLLFDVARRAFGVRAGLFAAWAGAFYPFFIFYAASLTNQLFSLLAALAVVDAYYWAKGRRAVAAAAVFGLVGGAAFLTRAEFLIPAILGAVFIGAADARAGLGRRGLARAAVAVGVGVLAALPWAVRNNASLDYFSFFATQGPRVLWEANVQPLSAEFGRGDVPAYRALYADLRRDALPTLKRADLAEMPVFGDEGEFERAAVVRARVGGFLRANPGVYFRLCGVRAAQFLRLESLNFGGAAYRVAYGSYALVLVLGLIGLAASLALRRPLYVYLLLAYGVAVLVFVVYGTAFRVASVDLWLILFAAWAADRGGAFAAGRRGRFLGRPGR